MFGAILTTFSFRKGFNAIQILLSYWTSKLLAKPIMWGKPISIAIEPTTSCNLRCPECPSGLRSFERPTGMLESSLFEKAVQELRKTTQYLTFYFQGEPYLHPEFTELVSLATKNKIITSTSTNAHYLDKTNAEKTVKSGLHRLIVSIDGSTQETYEKYRVGGTLNKALDGIKEIVSAKERAGSKFPFIELQFVVFKHNEHEIQDIKKLGKSLGVDKVSVKTAQIYDYKEGHDLIPSISQYSRYKKDSNGAYEIKSKLQNKCWKMWQSAVITWDGKVVPCCFDKDAKYTMGTIQEQRFADIWKSQPYQSFRSQILQSRKSIDICQNCTEGLSIFAE